MARGGLTTPYYREAEPHVDFIHFTQKRLVQEKQVTYDNKPSSIPSNGGGVNALNLPH